MEPTFRSRLAEQLRVRSGHWATVLAEHGTPVLLLDPHELERNYRALRTALPYVDWHFAVKAQPHPEVVRRLAGVDAHFDVASTNEVTVVVEAGGDPTRCLHSNPHKKRADITAAYRAGIRRFVVDNPGEVDKFVGVGNDVELLVRVATPNPHATIDLSSKFGAVVRDVDLIVKHALAQSVQVSGVSMHVGSQNLAPQAYAAAITQCLATMDAVTDAIGAPMTILDIGGGFPVPYLSRCPTSRSSPRPSTRPSGSGGVV